MHEYYAQENGKIYYAITSRETNKRSIQISEARCIKERSSDLRHSCGALLYATPAPAGALQVFLDHKKTSHPWT